MIEAKQIKGIAKIRLVIHEVNAVVDEMSRAGGFSPAQWVTGRLPRYAAGERGDGEQVEQLIGVEERVDPTTVFGERMKFRYEAKKAFAHADSSTKTAKDMLRKAAPLVGDYRAGDLIFFQREQKSYGIARKRWSSASSIIGFEGPANESEALA